MKKEKKKEPKKEIIKRILKYYFDKYGDILIFLIFLVIFLLIFIMLFYFILNDFIQGNNEIMNEYEFKIFKYKKRITWVILGLLVMLGLKLKNIW